MDAAPSAAVPSSEVRSLRSLGTRFFVGAVPSIDRSSNGGFSAPPTWDARRSLRAALARFKGLLALATATRYRAQAE
jgi:hypothetical protein